MIILKENILASLLTYFLLQFLTACSPSQAADLPEFTLNIKNAKFEPAFIEIPAAQKIRLVVKNEGPGAEEFESSDLNREQVVPPRKKVVIFIGPLKAGIYRFFGDFHKDTAQGKIVVK